MSDRSIIRTSTKLTTIDEVIISDALPKRFIRSPDYEHENLVMANLAKDLTSSPYTFLQKLVESALSLCRAGSAGISLPDTVNGEPCFRLSALSGRMAPYLYQTVPRAISPSGLTMDHRSFQLISWPHRYFPCIDLFKIPIVEWLLVPLWDNDEVIGTIWIMTHDLNRKFDGNDLRIMNNLSHFAAVMARKVLDFSYFDFASHDVWESSQRNLQMTLEAGAMTTWTWDLTTNRVIKDSHFDRLFLLEKRAKGDCNISHCISSIHPDDRERVVEGIREAINTEGSYEAEYRIVQLDSSIRWVASRGRLIRYGPGATPYIHGVLFDITSWKHREDHGRKNIPKESQSNEWLRMIFNQMPSMFTTAILSLDGLLLDVGGKSVEDSGYKKENVLGRVYWEVEWWGGMTVMGERVRSAFFEAKKGCVYRDEFNCFHVDGTERLVDCSFVPVFDDHQNIVFVGVLIMDITERAHYEQSIKIKTDRLEEADRRKDEFIAVLSHELRSPLNVITGHVDLMRLEHGSDSTLAESLSAIERNAKVQVQIISDLLDISRIMAGKMSLEMSLFDAEVLVDSAIESAHFAAVAKNIHLEKNCEVDIGVVVGDFGRLRQALWNLLSNSIKFTDPEGRILISISKSESFVVFKVTDTGRGIRPEFLPFVFDRFWQEEISKSRYNGGLGLGLAIVRHIAELHGGKVNAESEGRGKGSVFTLTLPRDCTDSKKSTGCGEMVSSQTSHKDAEMNQPLLGFKILVIDDQDDTRSLLNRILSKMGASVVAVNSASAALEALEIHDFNVIVSDIGMPDMDGLEFMREWRKREVVLSRKIIPSIALTAYATDKDQDAALEAGFHRYTSKPIKIMDLTKSIISVSRA